MSEMQDELTSQGTERLHAPCSLETGPYNIVDAELGGNEFLEEDDPPAALEISPLLPFSEQKIDHYPLISD
jgi:hypothetical protein